MNLQKNYNFQFYKTYIGCLDCNKKLLMVEWNNGNMACLYCPKCISFYHCATYIKRGDKVLLGHWRYNPKSIIETKYPETKVRLAIYNQYKNQPYFPII